MGIENIFDGASSAMTLISFATFLGIVLWAYAPAKRGDFDEAARLPFSDEAGEAGHG